MLGQKSDRRIINTNIKNRLDTYKRPLAIEVFLQGFRQFFPEDVVLAFGHSLNGEILTLNKTINKLYSKDIADMKLMADALMTRKEVQDE